jgi:hypothetical protein
MIVITSSKYLYMGNKMLQYAIFIAFAEENKIKIANPSFAPYAHHFKTTSADFHCRYPAITSPFAASKKLRMLYYRFMHRFGRFLASKKISNGLVHAVDIDWNRQCQINDPEFISLAKKTKYLFAMGWEFKHKMDLSLHREKIRRYFEPLDLYRRNITELMTRVKPGADLLVGVHIRQGDYETFEGGKYYFETAEYAALLLRISESFKDKKLRFLICSNCAQPADAFTGSDICFGTGQPVEDMYAFAECDYILGPPSTYTMWASFYGAKPLYMIYSAEANPKPEDFKILENLSV